MASKWKGIEQRYGLPMSSILTMLYERHGDKPNTQEIVATELGVSQPTVSQWIKFLRLEKKIVLVAPSEQPITCN